jgi:hypothetical protein
MEFAQRLLSQHVEVVRRGRRLGNCECVLRCQMEKAFEPSRRVVGTLALVAMRQQKYDARLLGPLRLA